MRILPKTVKHFISHKLTTLAQFLQKFLQFDDIHRGHQLQLSNRRRGSVLIRSYRNNDLLGGRIIRFFPLKIRISLVLHGKIELIIIIQRVEIPFPSFQD